ncbi:ASP1 L-asparaginase 1 [Candida maltosa Xu316]
MPLQSNSHTRTGSNSSLSSNFFPLNNSNNNDQIEVQAQLTDHPAFKIKYHRSNSIVSIATSSESNSLPNIKVLGTGGTIASKGLTSHQTAGYEVDLTIEDLVNSIPDLSTTCNLEYEQVLNIDSKEFDTEALLKLYRQIINDLPHYDGIVITHGTDTMEETAFFLQSTISTYKPIVLCGSMRPSTAISSDGPMNLYQAIIIASNQMSKNRGVLITLNDSIGSGFYITKSNANSLDTFKSIGQGYIGNFVNNEIRYFYPANKPLGLTSFDVGMDVEVIPEVVVIYAHQGLNNEMIKVILDNMKEVKGLVLATMGAGSLSETTNQMLYELVKDYEEEFPIVYSKRSMDGMVPIGSLPKVKVNEKGDKEVFKNAIAGGYLNPQKARILLQLCLNDKMDLNQIKEVFSTV